MVNDQDYYGYAGGVLYVDLTTRHIHKEPLDIDLAQKFVGGPGIGLNILNKMLKPNTDPLSPENVMVFGTGPLLGTIMIGSGKCYLNTKYAMPVSKDKKKYFIATSMFGSNRFGPMMKNAGYDHIVITGRAEKPCYLKVVDDDVEICDASDIWGRDIYESATILRDRHRGRNVKCGIWVIGRAGENMVSFGVGFADDWHNAGRFAAPVAGAKNLKGIVTLGTKGIKLANPRKFKELADKKRQEITSGPNYQQFLPFGGGAHGKLMQDTLVGLEGCSGGMCACKSIHEVKNGKYKGTRFGGAFPSFAAIVHMELGIEGYPDNHGPGFRFVDLANKYGLCVYTAIRMVRFVTTLYKRGVITKDDVGGLELKMGDIDFYEAILEKIVDRRDIGAIMAEGWYPMSEKLGVDASEDLECGAPITKGVDVLMDARIWPSLLRSDNTGLSPAAGLSAILSAKAKQSHSATLFTSREVPFSIVREDTNRMGVTNEEMQRIFTEDSFNSGRLLRFSEDTEFACNALGICDACLHWLNDPTRDIPWLSELYSAATGSEITPRELLRVGERIWTLEKVLNLREGFNRQDDKIPPLYVKNTEIPLKSRDGDRYLTDWFGKRLTKEDIVKMMSDYYEERGWDVQNGVPTKEKLIELGLDYLADGE